MSANKYNSDGGVLGGPDLDPEKIRRVEEAEALRLEQEAAAAKWETEIEAVCDGIDKAMEPHLREHLAAANAKSRISPTAKRDFARFKEYCLTAWDIPLPHLPAKPQVVAAFIIRETNYRTAQRLCRNISTIHRAVGFTDPTTDILVQAVLRSIKKGS